MSNQLFLQRLYDLRREEKHQEAVGLANSLICKDPSWAEPYEELGDNYLSLKEYEKAEKALLYAEKLTPDEPNVHYLLGFCYSSTNKFPESIAQLQTADRLSPHHPEILRCLGWSVFFSGKREEGLKMLKRASEMSPRDALILADLGVCLLNSHQFEEAISTLTRAVEVAPSDERIKEALDTAQFFKIEYEKLGIRDRHQPPPWEVFEGPPPEDLTPTL